MSFKDLDKLYQWFLYVNTLLDDKVISVSKPKLIPSTLIPDHMVNFRLNSRQMNSSPSFFPGLE